MSGRAGGSGFDRDDNTHAADDPVDHLWQAAHEFLAAARAVIDAG